MKLLPDCENIAEHQHPGVFLKKLLCEHKMTYTAFAQSMGVPINRITEICGGRRTITAETALLLAKTLEPITALSYYRLTPEFWLAQQMRYDLFLARKKLGEKKQ